ncbi:GNAT family N-acetyltransferase [Sansalvadorimonas sp. 2012CJ34-2]|uniref:GNAT family N-acetyltransferase n=1 Tax=Parendozoicomonas callyspongiae TaxID=2942213 RepID=A0ABT0PK37_9GAMM|nr:GNAT family protein [Sansalvadorimonas sp. 2012CJ34-2]MCL6271757.1 GNAT family N-acetyltransferase [Sansalvadorimonas sp. 2012CJ34-2]
MFKPRELTGRYIRLEAIAEDHLPGLQTAISDGDIWQSDVVTLPPPELMGDFVTTASSAFENTSELVYAIVDLSTQRVAGATAYTQASFFDERVEIGPTFIGKSWWGSMINKESKYLLMKHAFESWDLNRVEMQVDALNHRSRKAVLSLGAKEEGILRNHMVMPSGRVRDTVIYSILNSEWLDIKRHLQSLLY